MPQRSPSNAARHLRPMGRRGLWAPLFLVVGLVGLVGVDRLWRQSEERSAAVHAVQIADELGDVFRTRLGELTQLVAAVPPELKAADAELLVTALHGQASAFIEGVAIIEAADYGDTEVLSVAPPDGPAARRAQARDLRQTLHEWPAGHTLSVLEDGRLMAVRALDPSPAKTPRFAVAFAPASALFNHAIAAQASFVVRDDFSKQPNIFRGGVVSGTDREGRALVRTLLHQVPTLSVTIWPVPKAEASARLMALALAAAFLMALTALLYRISARRSRSAADAGLYRTLFEVAGELVVVVDLDLRVISANSAAERAFSIFHPDDYGGPVVPAVMPDDQPAFMDALHAALNGATVEVDCRLLIEPTRLFRVRAVPVYERDRVLGLQVLGEDVTEARQMAADLAARQVELEAANAELFTASTTDALTGALNRRQLMRRAEEEVARAQRYGHPLTCLFLDIDHFKRVNDTFGHASGDEVLKAFSALIMDRTRAGDVVGRYGGEEFVVLLTNTPQSHVPAVAESILGRVREASMAGVPEGYRITASMGAAGYSTSGPANVSALFQAADAALYEAKNGGRDRFVIDRSLKAA